MVFGYIDGGAGDGLAIKRNSLSLFHIESLKRQRRKYIKTKTENMIGIAAVWMLLDSPDRYPKLSKALY